MQNTYELKRNVHCSIIKFIVVGIFSFWLVPDNCIAQNCNPAGGPQNGPYGQGGNNNNGNSGPKNSNSPEAKPKVVRPKDPNELVGSNGYDIKKWVSINDRVPFTILFENDPKAATAPAQNVFVRLPVDQKININSLQLGDFGFGKYRFTVPVGSSFYSGRLDLRDSLHVYVDVTAGIDVINNEIFWRFRSIDPATGLTPTDPLSGFLPVNDSVKVDSIPGRGEGFVNFTIKPLSTAQTGDTTYEKASIIFNTEEPIVTNSWTNTIDAIPPSSKVNGTSVLKDTISLHWSGTDDTNGSGVKDYALYYAEKGGAFTLYKQHILDTTIKFVGTPGKTYCFFTIASDNTNNKEDLKAACEATAEISLDAVALPITWLYFNARESGKDAILNWATTSEINSKFFAIERSYDGVHFIQIGSVQAAGNSSLTNNYAYTDKEAMILPYDVLYYRLRQVDNDGKFTYSIIISIRIPRNSAEPLVSAYPNPFRQNITLKIIAVTPTDKTDNVELYSLDGKNLYNKKLQQRGSATILLDNLPQLTPGVYLLKTIINGKLYTIKMVRE